MPQRQKGARLWLKPAERGRDAIWCVKDGSRRVSTGCGADDTEGAERALVRYLAEKHARAAASARSRPIDETPIGDVILAYWQAKEHAVARPVELRARLANLADHLGDITVNDISPQLTAEYARKRGAAQAARRELEDLRAAINHAAKHRVIAVAVPVDLPQRAKARERWLTRNELAALVWHCWRYREIQKGSPGRYTRRHVARFLIMARYTGSRAGAICAASYTPAKGRGWVDLENGLFYRAADMEVPTAKRKPTIKLPPQMWSHLVRWRDAAERAHRAGRRKTPPEHVVEWNGKPVGSLRKALARACEDVKLEGVSAHVLRHTCATWLMQNGAEKWETAGFLGMTVELLEERYGHHHHDFQSSVHRALSGKRSAKRSAVKIVGGRDVA